MVIGHTWLSVLPRWPCTHCIVSCLLNSYSTYFLYCPVLLSCLDCTVLLRHLCCVTLSLPVLSELKLRDTSALKREIWIFILQILKFYLDWIFISEIEYQAVVKEEQPLPEDMYITSNNRMGDIEKTLQFRIADPVARSLPEQNRRVSGQPAKLGEPLKPYSSAVRPAHETELGGGLSRLIGGILPNSYYSRPQFRYPYYDTSGKERISFNFFRLILSWNFPFL